MNTKSKNILITGASRGFGRATVIALLKQGHHVIAGVRGGEERGQVLFSDFLGDDKLTFVDLHLDNSATIQACGEAVERSFKGRLDVLINNAGYGLLGPLELQTPEQVQKQFEVHVFGPLKLIQTLLPNLRAVNGRILNMTSMAEYAVFPFYGSYSASKHALGAITESLYFELRPFGIQVCAIEPGGFATDFNSSFELAAGSGEVKMLYQKRNEAFLKFIEVVKQKIEKDPSIVIQEIVSLCEMNKIPLRKRIGTDAHLNWWMKTWLPECLRVRMQYLIFEKLFFSTKET